MAMKTVVGVLVAVAALGVGLYASGHLPGGFKLPTSGPSAATAAAPGTAGTPASTAPAVSVVKATTSDFVETVVFTGSVIARDEILVAPEVEGFRVEELAADEGQSITKGQMLARLASDTLDAQLAKNEADVARAGASIAVARSGIAQAEAVVKEAGNAFDRIKPLKQSGYASGATYDQRESAAATADAKLVSARDSLKSAEADKAAFEAARRELTWKRSRTDIRSPVDGIISRRSARVGGVASAVGDPMFRIIARGDVEIDAEVAESDIHKVHDGQLATASITGLGEVTGTVRLISSEVDKATRLGRVKIFLGPNRELRLGAFGRGRIVTAKARGVSVPTSAIVYTNDGASVLVVVDGRVEQRPVKVGLKTVQAVEITQGLMEGETVVARSGSFLRSGDLVRPVFADAKVGEVR